MKSLNLIFLFFFFCIFSIAHPVLSVEQLKVRGTIVAGGGIANDGTNIINGSIDNIQLSTLSDGNSSIRPFDNSLNEQLRLLGFRFEGNAVDTSFGQQLLIPLVLQPETTNHLIEFHFRQGGAIEYQTTILTEISRLDSGYLFDSNPYALRGIEYYLEISNQTGRVQVASVEHPLSVVTSFDNLRGRAPDYFTPNEYHLVSFPLSIIGPQNASSVFFDDLGPYDQTAYRLGRYNAVTNQTNEYPNIPDITAGISYWLIGAERLSFGSPGYSLSPNRVINGKAYYSIPLDSGWNQLGNPFAFNIPFEQLRIEQNDLIYTVDQNMVEDSAYWYVDGRFRTTSTLFPWHGFFLFSHHSDASLLFPYQPVVANSQPTSKLASFSLLIQLSVLAGNKIDDGNYIGISNSERYSYRDLPNPPGQPNLAIVDRDNKNLQLRSSYLLSTEEHSWLIRAELPSDGRLILQQHIDLTTETEITIRESSGHLLAIDSACSVKLKAGLHWLTVALVEKSNSNELVDLPERFELRQNFPNPFNSSTSISFDLPEAALVTLDIFDLNGRRTLTLVNKEFPAGHHFVNWDGLNSSGRVTATGIYFYRIKAGRFESTRKMILLK